MSNSRPPNDPLSFHKPPGQYYVTRDGRRLYLGADHGEALTRYHRMALGEPTPQAAETVQEAVCSLKELANRFLTAQEANWRNPKATRQGYRSWLKQFLRDHRGVFVNEYTVEMFAAWKLSLKERG